MITLRRYAWVGAVAAALVLSPSGGAHSGADWEAAYAGTDWEEIRRAAEGGDAEAQIRLGNVYLGDEGALVAPDEIPKNDVRAYVWLSLGVAGLSDASTDELLIARDLAMDDLRRLEERLTALQLSTAQQLIQDRRGGGTQAEQTSTIREAQRLLRELGYAPGPSDGIWGPRTERAYRSYLRDAGLPDVAFSARVLEGMREATRSAAGHAARAEQPGTGQVETSEDGTGGAAETIVYDNGSRYDGQTRGGEPHGRGVITWTSGNHYEGDFVEGKRTGRGVFTWANGERYEGEFRDGERHGRGLLIRADGSREEVEYREGMLHGSVLTWADGRRYEGETLHGKAHGRGVMTWPSGKRYEGDFVKGKRTGRGIYDFSNGNRYEGDFVDGDFQGHGIYAWADGKRYEGQWRADRMHGQGVFTWPNSNRYEGDFRGSWRHGQGTFIWANGDRYEGDFVEDKRTGRGVFTWPSGDRYEGDFVDGDIQGRGDYTFTNGDRYEGEFRSGKIHGQGVYTRANGGRVAGEFRDGKHVGDGNTSSGAGSSTTSTTQTEGAGSRGTTSTAAGSSGGSSAGQGTGNALDCLTIQDVSVEYEYPNFWLTNNCRRPIVLHFCGIRQSSLRKCRELAKKTPCGIGNPPMFDKWSTDPPRTGWKDRYYGWFTGVAPNTRSAVSCSEEFRYAACFYNADAKRKVNAGNAGEYWFYPTDPKYVFEADKDGTFRCRWGDEVSDDARGQQQR